MADNTHQGATITGEDQERMQGRNFLEQLGDYATDALSAGPGRRLAGHLANGEWSAAAGQAANMGGTPLGSMVMGGQPEGAPNFPGHDASGSWQGFDANINPDGSVVGSSKSGSELDALNRMRSQFLSEYDRREPTPVERTEAAQSAAEQATSANMGQAATYQAAQVPGAAQAAAEMARAGEIGPAAQAQAMNAQAGQVGPATYAKAAEIAPTTKADAFGVKGEQLNTGNSDQARTVQQEAIGATRDVLSGKAPSVAEMQLRNTLNRNVADQNARAAGARGLGVAGARRQAAMNIARLNADAAESGALVRAQEQATARGQLGGLATDTRGQDISQSTTQAGLNQDANKFTAGASQQASQFNAAAENQRGLTQAQLTTGVNQGNAAASNQAAITQAGLNTDVWQGNANRQAQTSQFNAGQQNAVNTSQAGLNTQVSLGNANNATGVSQFNAGQTNDINRFNAGATNDASQFNAGATNQRAQAQGAQDTAVSQSNAQLGTQNNQFNAGQVNATAAGNADRALNGQQITNNRDASLRGDAIQSGIGAANAQNGVATQENQKREQNANMVKSVATGVAALSDRRAKENVGRPSDAEVTAFLESIKPSEFDYKPGVGDDKRHVGVMAQDVDDTPMGRGFVIETGKGKALDAAQAVGPMLVALRHLSDRINEMDGKRRKAAVEMR